MWFVQAIIVLYLFFYLFRYIDVKINNGNQNPLLSFIILFVLAMIATPLVRWANIGDPISVPLFFIGVAIARWPKVSRRMFRSVPIVLLILVALVAVSYFWRTDNRVLHGVINYFVMTVFVSLLAFVNVRITKMPKWVGSSSYDLYLVHYKTHLLLVFILGVDYLWTFVLGTTLATIGFYQMRKLCKI